MWIVLEGPDMTYYGDAEIHGVFATEEEAAACARVLDPDWKGADWEPLGVEEWTVGEEAQSVEAARQRNALKAAKAAERTRVANAGLPPV